MKKPRYRLTLLQFTLFASMGCASLVPQKQTVAISETDETVESLKPTDQITELQDTETAHIRYEAEYDILERIVNNLDEAAHARREGYYGLAETTIEDALILTTQVDLDLIQNDDLKIQFIDALAAVAQENGRILHESSVIAEEDPMAWLEDVDIEQFRSGQWSDEELETIVNKIALKCDVPIEFNKKVRNAIYYFQNGRRNEMIEWQKRSGRYLDMMRDVFAEEDLPLDLVYLSMIESGFKPAAYSPARAVGLWQFIYATGKVYGLDRNQWIDERRDPVLATQAAARHLKDLYKQTDDWNIVMALYNCSPTRIIRQLEQSPNIEYWDMQLPRETENYVPFFMAAVVMSKAPEIFGFDNIEKDPPLEYDTVKVHSYTSLSIAADCAGSEVASLKELNPQLLKDRTPPDMDEYELRIPKNTAPQFVAAYEQIPADTFQPPQTEYVLVQRGDTFSGIADRYRVSMSSLRDANPQIGNISRLSIGQRVYMPGTTRTSTIRQPVAVDRNNTKSYTVQRNDTLGVIARRNGTTYQVIQALNNMGSSTRIYPGDRLLVPGTSQSSTTTIASTSSGNAQSYTVQRNDTLDGIAQRYGTTYQVLQQLNNMGSRTRIYPGNTIKVPASGSSTVVASNATTTDTGSTVYVIQKNDTIYEVAQRFGVDYRNVLEQNNITDHRKIKPGDRIVINK